MMLTKKIEKALNNQIVMEAYASSSYLSMASWCETKGYRGSSAFYYQQSEEEREHMLKLVKYINQTGARAVVPSIEAPPIEYKSLLTTFELSLRQEQDVTKSINDLVDLTLTNKDYTSNHFLKWYIVEQHEEENLFRSILDIFKIGGEGEENLLIIDNEIIKIREKESPVEFTVKE